MDSPAFLCFFGLGLPLGAVPAEAGLDFHAVEGVGAGEREAAQQVDELVLLDDLPLGDGAVACDGGADVVDLEFLVVALGVLDVNTADRQLAPALSPYLGRPDFGVVEAEVSAEGDVIDVFHLDDAPQVEGGGVDVTGEVLGLFVKGEMEVHAPGGGVQDTAELLFLVEDVEVALVLEGLQVFELFHHEFLHHELVDDVLGGMNGGHHAPDMEAERELLFLPQMGGMALCLDAKLPVGGVYVDVLEEQGGVGAAQLDLQLERDDKVCQGGREGLGEVFQQGLSRDERGLVGEAPVFFLAG